MGYKSLSDLRDEIGVIEAKLLTSQSNHPGYEDFKKAVLNHLGEIQKLTKTECGDEIFKRYPYFE